MQIYDLQALSGATCWWNVITYLCGFFFLSTIAIRSLFAWTPSPVPIRSAILFWVCRCLGILILVATPGTDTALKSDILKALCFVKHESPATRTRQIGVTCHALTTEAFTSFCQMFDGATCFCLQPPHGVVDSTVFYFLEFSRLFGLTLRLSRSCLSMPPGTLTTSEAVIFAGSRAWFPFFSTSLWPPCSSLRFDD